MFAACIALRATQKTLTEILLESISNATNDVYTPLVLTDHSFLLLKKM